MIALRTGAPLRVCLVAPYDLAARGGGVKHHIFGLAAALRARGDSVTILGPASRPLRKPGVVTIGGIVSIQSNGSSNEMPLFASPFETARFFQSHAFDVIHVHEPPIPSLTYWVSWLTPGVPKLCTFHAYADAPPLLLRLGQKLFGALQYPFFTHGLAVSQAAAEYAGRAWKRPLSIVPNGIDTELFAPRARAAEPNRMRLLFVGRLADERKGWRVMLEAYERLLARGVQVSLDVVGDRAGVPAPPTLPGLRLHGSLPRSELIEHYRACDLFIAPSLRQESFGIVLLEAMASGAAIVCSDIRGYRDVARPEGAAFVPPSDPERLAAAIAALAADPSRRAAMHAANVIAVAAYRWPVLAERVREHYLAAIAATRRLPARAQPEVALEGAFAVSSNKRLASTNPRSSTGIV